MNGAPTQTLRRIRTLAADIEAAQNPAGIVATAVPDTEVPAGHPVETVKVAPIATFKATPPSTEHIPAFHELKKETAHNHTMAASTVPAAASIPKITVRAKKRDLTQAVSAGGGMVITDTKQNKQNFISAFVTSIEAWFHSFSATSKKKSRHTYTVTDTERRKGVIQKATSKTGTIFTADNETLKEEIRRRSQERPHTPPDTEPHLSWSPHTEAGYALLEGDVQVTPTEPQRVMVEFKKVATPVPLINEPVAPTPAPEPVSTWEAPLPLTPPIAPEVAATPLEERQWQVAPVTPLAQTAPPLTTPNVVAPAFAEPRALTRTDAIKDRLRLLMGTLRVNTNFITIGIAGILIFAALLALSARAVFLIISAPPQGADTPAAIPLLPRTQAVDLKLASLTESALISALTQNATLTGTVTEYRLLTATGEVIPPADTLALLGFTDNQNLNQTITEVHVVTLNNQRGIVFAVADATTAFGAMLAWEPRMLRYIGPILGVDTSDAPFAFTDQTIANTDVRILTMNGTQRLTYGFIDKDTILVTEDIGAFYTMLGSQ